MISRRNLLSALGIGTLAAASHRAEAQHEGHSMPMPATSNPSTVEPDRSTTRSTPVAASAHYTPVRTLNGWTLPFEAVDGVKEFHLVAEEVEHEFAPGCIARCWGYNGSTPGPTLEAVEGDRVRIFVTNRLAEATSMHWHGLILPSGMDGVSGISQSPIAPGETYVYEFTLRQHGSHMYHPHADEMTQMAMGMMGLFVIHPREREAIDRDFALILHNWALHPGTSRPDPSVLQDFDLWTFNSKTFPAIEPLVARTGERVRIRVGNLSMWNHPIHLHGVEFHVTGSDGGRWPRSAWQREVTTLVGVGQMRDIEFTAVAGDWAFHCHMSHHTMGPMGHGIPNTVGVDQGGVEAEIRALLPGYMAMGENGMSEHAGHVAMGMMQGPENTLPMMGGEGPHGPIEMGGMFTLVKVRDDVAPGDYRDPGWYAAPRGTMASRVSGDPDFGRPIRRATPIAARESAPAKLDPQRAHRRHGS